MTPHEYIASNPTLEDSRGKWLVFTASLAADLAAKQAAVVAQTGTVHRIGPIALTDGRYAVSCDVVTEINGGILTPHFQSLDQSKLALVEVLPHSEVEPLIPKPQDIQ